MSKKLFAVAGLPLLLFALSGCAQVGSKTATMSAIYLVTTILAMILLLGYCFLLRKKEPWFVVLFSAVVVVNSGYFALSVSNTLGEALLANRVSYLGSVILPVTILMLVMNVCNIQVKKWIVTSLVLLSVVVFLIAASPGYSTVYYKEVSLIIVDGVASLKKEYGPLHSLYLYYLLGLFGAIVGVIIYAFARKMVRSPLHGALLAGAAFVNFGVWLMEQLVDIDFEFLSVSYIVSELFLLGISLMVQDSGFRESLVSLNIHHTQPKTEETHLAASTESADDLAEKFEFLTSRLYTLTPTEKEIYRMYLQGYRTKDAMQSLGITENTLKYHNRNIYSKLGVANRKELVQVAQAGEKVTT